MSTRPARRPTTAATQRPHDDDLGVLLTLALAEFKEQLHAHLASAGYDDLGPSFGFVFRSLADTPLSLVALSHRLGISAQGTLKIATEMVDRGYVERHDDADDKRVRRLALTARGRSALREARRFHTLTEKHLNETVGPRHVAGARAVLRALAADRLGAELNWGDVRPF